jgi:prepilin signal peptidase PulO-like enzyme (type II secretory pathway)
MLAFILMCVSVIDAHTQEIPDGLLLLGVLTAALWIAAGQFSPASPYLNAPGWRDALLGGLAGAAPLFVLDRLTYLLAKKVGFGFGDVKLMAMAGLFIGWRHVLASFCFAFIAGGVWGIFLLASGRAKRGTYFAFGPFLALGILAAQWFGDGFFAMILWQ